MFDAASLNGRQSDILARIQACGTTTRRDLADVLDLPLVTVARLVSDLRDAGVLNEESSTPDGRGRPTSLVRVNGAAALALGIELTDATWAWSLQDAALDVVAEGSRRRHDGGTGAHSLAAALRGARDEAAAAGHDLSRLGSIVVALHAPVTAAGDVFLDDQSAAPAYNVGAVAKQVLGKGAVATDPARVFALQEHDPALDPPDAAYVLFGEHGAGMGAIVDHRLLRSWNGICGEVGHVRVHPGSGPPMPLERATNARRIVADAMASEWAGDLPAAGEATLADICVLARDGHAGAGGLLDAHLDVLAEAMAAAVSVLGSELVVLGGEWNDAGDARRQAFLRSLRSWLAPMLANRLDARFARQGAATLASGAALLAAQILWVPEAIRTDSFFKVSGGSSPTASHPSGRTRAAPGAGMGKIR